MSSLDDRRESFEKKFAHDEELRFRVEARTCRIFGMWVAEQLGLKGSEAEAYARTVIESNLEEPGYDDVKRKVQPDLKAKGIEFSDHRLDTELAKCMEEAKRQIIASG